jgi:bile acid-coenzyme A ligase
MALISYAARLLQHVAADPDRPAVTDEHRTVTRAELDDLATRTAHALGDLGVGQGDRVTIALPNSVEFLAAVVACWKLGATPQPVSFAAPAREVQAIVELADSKAVIGAEPASFGTRACLPRGWQPPDTEAHRAPLPDAVANPFKAMTSGGSTGRPKLILAGDAALIDPDARPMVMLDAEGKGCLVMPGPLYHNGPFMWSTTALLSGNHVALGGRFDAEATLAMIDRHRGDVIYLVPTMMQRIWRLDPEVRERYDVSSLRAVWHLAAPCPAWLKEAWCEWLGAEKIWELYAGTEAQASTIINGAEWMQHKGSVGRTFSGEMKIVRADGTAADPGEVGEIFMRAADRTKRTDEYVGAQARTIGDGWESLGDMGSIDADGYLYLADRKTDMILVGGSNVYPAEVEAALEEHPGVQSAVVIGLPDADLGSVPHALVHAPGGAIDTDQLRAHLAERLVRYKIPRSFEHVDEPLRDDAGKVRRSALRAARVDEPTQT